MLVIAKALEVVKAIVERVSIPMVNLVSLWNRPMSILPDLLVKMPNPRPNMPRVGTIIVSVRCVL
jgi:hypothetical protein